MPGSSPAGITTCVVGSLMVGQRIVIPSGAGSNPVLPPNYEHVSEWPKDAGCNPVIRWFESGRVLQYGESSLTVKRAVVVRVLTVRFCPFTPDNLKFSKN